MVKLCDTQNVTYHKDEVLCTVGALAGVDVSFQWFDKTTTRLPEALMLQFSPPPRAGHEYRLSKLGQLVDPTNVILNGSQYQHGKHGSQYQHGRHSSQYHPGKNDDVFSQTSITANVRK